MPNNIAIEFRQLAENGKSDFVIYHKQIANKEYIHELIKRDDNIYYGDIKSIKSTNKVYMHH